MGAAMILGIAITGPMVVIGGLTVFSLLLFQLLVGLRIIKFGRKTFKMHKWVGVGLVVLAAVHGLLGATLVLGLLIP